MPSKRFTKSDVEIAESVFNQDMKDKNLLTDRKFIIPKKVNSSDDFTEKRRQFYLSDENFGLSKDALKQITDAVDWDLMKFYGYKPKKEN